jgi:hypothetical protein
VIPSDKLASSHDALLDQLATTQSELATTQSPLNKLFTSEYCDQRKRRE